LCKKKKPKIVSPIKLNCWMKRHLSISKLSRSENGKDANRGGTLVSLPSKDAILDLPSIKKPKIFVNLYASGKVKELGSFPSLVILAFPQEIHLQICDFLNVLGLNRILQTCKYFFNLLGLKPTSPPALVTCYRNVLISTYRQAATDLCLKSPFAFPPRIDDRTWSSHPRSFLFDSSLGDSKVDADSLTYSHFATVGFLNWYLTLNQASLNDPSFLENLVAKLGSLCGAAAAAVDSSEKVLFVKLFHKLVKFLPCGGSQNSATHLKHFCNCCKKSFCLDLTKTYPFLDRYYCFSCQDCKRIRSKISYSGSQNPFADGLYHHSRYTCCVCNDGYEDDSNLEDARLINNANLILPPVGLPLYCSLLHKSCNKCRRTYCRSCIKSQRLDQSFKHFTNCCY